MSAAPVALVARPVPVVPAVLVWPERMRAPLVGMEPRAETAATAVSVVSVVLAVTLARAGSWCFSTTTALTVTAERVGKAGMPESLVTAALAATVMSRPRMVVTVVTAVMPALPVSAGSVVS